MKNFREEERKSSEREKKNREGEGICKSFIKCFHNLNMLLINSINEIIKC